MEANTKEQLVSIFMDLVKLSSPSRNERLVADYIINKIKPYNLEVIEDDTAKAINGICGNLIIKMPGIGTPLLFSAHMDTVSPCEKINPKIIDDVIYSDGTSVLGADDKAGVAILLTLIIHLCESNINHAPITFIFSVCEEDSLQGIKHLNKKYYQDIKYAYVLDGEGAPGSVVNQTPHGCKGTLTITGKEAHAGVNPEDGINALYVAAQAIAILPNGRVDTDTTCNIGVVSGGTATNVVMGEVTMNFEARSYHLEKLKALIKNVEHTFEETCNTYQAIFTSKLKYGTPGYFYKKDDSIFNHLREVCESMSLPFHVEACGGASNASIYIANGITTFNLGVGMKEVHSTNEHISISDLLNSYQLVESLCLYLNLSK